MWRAFVISASIYLKYRLAPKQQIVQLFGCRFGVFKYYWFIGAAGGAVYSKRDVKMAIIQSLKITRSDGVTFVYNKYSPNRTEINFLTAHDDFWASVPVGQFASALDAIQASENFIMPVAK